MNINEHTKIASLLKMHEGSLEAIIKISPKFEKLRNPFLRKLMAKRASIKMACTIASCEIEEFYQALRPLGFQCTYAKDKEEIRSTDNIPEFIKKITQTNIVELDVRPILQNGRDPLNEILEAVNSLDKNKVLKIVNTFEPTPLIELLKKRGFEYFVEEYSTDQVNTYFNNKNENKIGYQINEQKNNFDTIYERFKNQLIEIDVRDLHMPMPMMTILAALDDLEENKALFVFHKKIPIFLIPELADRNYDYAINEVNENNVNMIIYRNDN